MEKLTKKDIMRLSAYGKVLYTNQPVKGLKHLNKLGYNSGVYGWNYDVYEYGCNVLLVGYRVPSFATYVSPEEVEKVAIKVLKEKIESMDITKERLIKELQALKQDY